MEIAYDLELDKVIEEINRIKATNILVQLPDGLKPKATEIVNILKEKTKANILIWLGSCWGSCDYPEIRNIDLLIQFGHAPPGELTPKPG